MPFRRPPERHRGRIPAGAALLLSPVPPSGTVTGMRHQASSSVHPSNLFARLALGAVLAGSAAANAGSGAASSVAPPPTIHVLAAWVRWLPAGLPEAGYLTLANTGDKPLSLERATSPAYEDVSIHQSVMRGNEEQMVPVKSIAIAAHATLDFQSQGYHLMLMQPTAAAASAKQVPVTLYFSNGASLTVPLEIRRNPNKATP